MTQLRTEKKADQFVDVLIIGAGVAGLTLAVWLGRCGIQTLVMDNKSDRVKCGHADTIEARTWEILDGFGLATPLWDTAKKTNELSIWSNADSNTGIQRKLRRNTAEPARTSRYSEARLHQGYLEEALLRDIEASETVQVVRNTSPLELEVVDTSAIEQEEHDLKHPIKLITWTFKQSRRNSTGVQTYCAQYLVGCDGTESWIRKKLGISCDGMLSRSILGAIDVVPITNFPDIRTHCIINSANHGSIVITPRERNLIRVYAQLDDDGHQKISETHHQILAKARRILAPYSFNFKHCEWSSNSQISHRLASKMSSHNCVFLCGEAVHGQTLYAGGINTSIQDAYNLGWKLAEVIRGQAPSSLLESYGTERHEVGKRAIEHDSRTHQIIYEKSCPKEASIIVKTLQEKTKGTSGIYTNYATLCPKSWVGNRHPSMAPASSSSGGGTPTDNPGIELGVRIPDVRVSNQCDGCQIPLHRLLPSTGHWRLLLFPGNISSMRTHHVTTLLDLCNSETIGEISTMTDRFQILTFHASPREDINLTDLPRELVPYSEAEGYSYDRVFLDCQEPYGNDGHDGKEGQEGLYQRLFGSKAADDWIPRIVLVRPDLHVAFVGGFDEVDGVLEMLDDLYA